MDRARIVQIISGFAVEGPLGGIERFGIELSRNLDSALFEPILCGLWRYHTPYEKQWVDRLRKSGIEAFFAADWNEERPYQSFFSAWRGILEHLNNTSVDLIHSHCQFGDVAAILIARRLHPKAMLRTVHNEKEWPKRPWRRWLLTDAVYPLFFQQEVGVSQRVRDNLRHRLTARLLGRESLCIYNAIDLNRFRSSKAQGMREKKRQELRLPLEEPMVITVGRLTRQKGYVFLLQAASIVLQEIPSIRFVIVGEGELEEELRSTAEELGIEHAILFTGSRQDVEALLHAADLFVSSSLWEGLPTVILESMAAKLPVVATDVSGTRELVQDRDTGILVSPGNSQALARAIAGVLQQREHVTKMTETAYRRVREFSIASVARQYEGIYQSLLGTALVDEPQEPG